METPRDPSAARRTAACAGRLFARAAAPRLLVLPASAALVGAVAASALGFFAATGQGTASASAGTLPAPTVSALTPGAGTVYLAWSPVAPPGAGPIAYYVTRDGGAPTGCPSSASPATVTSCTDTGLLPGPHGYSVTAVWHSWSTTSSVTNVTLASGVPTMLAFTSQPAGAVAGATLASVKVSVEDAAGNVATADNSTAVTLTIGTNPGGGTLSGGGRVTVANGVATYAGLSIDKSAVGYTLTASDTTGAGGGHPYSAATSSVFAITPAVASQLVFSTQPGSATAGAAFGQQPVVTTRDSFGNFSTVGLGSSRSVTVSLVSGTGMLGGTATLDIGTAAGNGTVTFAGLRIDSAGVKALQVAAAAGDPTLAAATSASFTVAQAAPTLTAAAPSAGTAGTAIAASAITAALASSSGSGAAGTITFSYFQQTAAPATCAGGTSIGTATVGGDGTYSPSTGFTPSVAGNYWLYASYAGDTSNQAAASVCPPGAAQKIVVAKAPSTLTATAPASGTAGTSINATSFGATLAAGSGSNATGTITFTVFGPQAGAPSNCSSGGTIVDTATVSGNGSYKPGTGFTPTVAGTYWLYASYSGDGNNQASASACPPGAPQKTVVASAPPTLTATGPAAATAGIAIAASAFSATLASSSGSNAAGTITFTYFQQASAPTTCSSGGTSLGTATVTGNGSYSPSAGFTPAVAGNYWLYTSYGGDANNQPASSPCPPGTAQKIVVAKATSSLTATAPGAGTAGTAVAASAISATLGATSGSNAAGTITFTYFQQASAPTTCSSGGTSLGTATVTGSGSYSPSGGFTPSVAGNYWLYASYGGDANNLAASSACPPGAAQKIVVAKAAPTLAAAAPSTGTVGAAIATSALSATLGATSGSNATGTITFTYFQQASAPTTCSSGGTSIGTATANGNGTYSPSAGFTPTVAGNYWLYASYGGDANNQAAAAACPPGAPQEIVVAKATPTLSVTAPSTGVAGTAIPASAITATLASGSSPTGTITFTVFGPQATPPTTCTSGGSTVGTAVVNGNNAYHPAAGYTPTAPGTYWWYAAYGGDANNQAAAAPCGAAMPQTTVTLLLQFSSCSLGTGGVSISCPATGGATVSLKRSNQGGGSWTAKVTLTDSSGNAVVNTTGSTITVTVAKLTSGATITYSSGTALTIPNGSSQSSNSFTYSNAGVGNGGGSDTVTASATGYTSAAAAVSW